jgi:hypothetical protein
MFTAGRARWRGQRVALGRGRPLLLPRGCRLLEPGLQAAKQVVYGEAAATPAAASSSACRSRQPAALAPAWLGQRHATAGRAAAAAAAAAPELPLELLRLLLLLLLPERLRVLLALSAAGAHARPRVQEAVQGEGVLPCGHLVLVGGDEGHRVLLQQVAVGLVHLRSVAQACAGRHTVWSPRSNSCCAMLW